MFGAETGKLKESNARLAEEVDTAGIHELNREKPLTQTGAKELRAGEGSTASPYQADLVCSFRVQDGYLNIRVTNEGTVDAPRFSVKYDRNPGGGSHSINGLGAGRTVDVPITFRIPDHVTGVVDFKGQVSESDETNNSCAYSKVLASVDPDIPEAAAPILAITGLNHQIGATRGTVLVRTDVPADEITVHAEPAPGAPDHRQKEASASNTQETTLALVGLSPDTQYAYSVVARKGETTVVHTGSFRTMRRMIRLVITSIHAVDDGDDVGDGDFHFTFCARVAEGGLCNSYPGKYRIDFAKDIGTGETAHVEYTTTVPDWRDDVLGWGVGVREGDDPGSGSLAHLWPVVSFDWVSEQRTDWQTKSIQWDINHTEDNPFHVIVKGKLQVRLAAAGQG